MNRAQHCRANKEAPAQRSSGPTLFCQLLLQFQSQARRQAKASKRASEQQIQLLAAAGSPPFIIGSLGLGERRRRSRRMGAPRVQNRIGEDFKALSASCGPGGMQAGWPRRQARQAGRVNPAPLDLQPRGGGEPRVDANCSFVISFRLGAAAGRPPDWKLARLDLSAACASPPPSNGPRQLASWLAKGETGRARFEPFVWHTGDKLSVCVCVCSRPFLRFISAPVDRRRRRFAFSPPARRWPNGVGLDEPPPPRPDFNGVAPSRGQLSHRRRRRRRLHA